MFMSFTNMAELDITQIPVSAILLIPFNCVLDNNTSFLMFIVVQLSTAQINFHIIFVLISKVLKAHFEVPVKIECQSLQKVREKRCVAEFTHQVLFIKKARKQKKKKNRQHIYWQVACLYSWPQGSSLHFDVIITVLGKIRLTMRVFLKSKPLFYSTLPLTSMLCTVLASNQRPKVCVLNLMWPIMIN